LPRQKVGPPPPGSRVQRVRARAHFNFNFSRKRRASNCELGLCLLRPSISNSPIRDNERKSKGRFGVIKRRLHLQAGAHSKLERKSKVAPGTRIVLGGGPSGGFSATCLASVGLKTKWERQIQCIMCWIKRQVVLRCVSKARLFFLHFQLHFGAAVTSLKWDSIWISVSISIIIELVLHSWPPPPPPPPPQPPVHLLAARGRALARLSYSPADGGQYIKLQTSVWAPEARAGAASVCFDRFD